MKKLFLLSILSLLFSCSSDEPENNPTLPVLTTTNASNITLIGALSGGNITSDGGADITARGVVWSTTQNPTIALSTKTVDGTSTGSFTSSISGLTPNTTYYIRAYATNSVGTSYGNEINFTTSSIQLPVITTSTISNITQNTASSGGNIISDGGGAVTARGVVWSTSQNPTVALSTKTTDGSGIGAYTSNITGLSSNTQYYVRAYATNSAGTAYGNEVSFTTLASLPILTTSNVSSIQNNSAISGGNITSDGGSNVTARGVVWSTSQNPTVALSTKTIDGSGIGAFTSNITGLSSNTQYYVRAYVTNSAGTAYGNEVSFTTLITPNYAAMYPTGTVFCNNIVTAVVDVTNPTTGKTWMDRNLGASQVATSSTDVASYGDLYQWGRRADGHQCRTSASTTTLSSSDQPIHGNFILSSPNSPRDWRNPQNSNLWQGNNGTNNPCPSGYRLPTESELNSEIMSWGQNNTNGAFNSLLKIPAAGFRYAQVEYAVLGEVGLLSIYWSSTVSGTNSRYIYGASTEVIILSGARAQGCTVRCIKN